MTTTTSPFYVVIEQDGELVYTNKDEQEATADTDTGTTGGGTCVLFASTRTSTLGSRIDTNSVCATQEFLN